MASSGVTGQTDRVTVAAAVLAACLGLASAAVSAYWALGGDDLLDTVGGEIERWGRARDAQVVVVLWLIVVLKTIVADATALAWHAYVWDPWFAIWGLAFVVALWRSRSLGSLATLTSS